MKNNHTVITSTNWHQSLEKESIWRSDEDDENSERLCGLGTRAKLALTGRPGGNPQERSSVWAGSEWCLNLDRERAGIAAQRVVYYSVLEAKCCSPGGSNYLVFLELWDRETGPRLEVLLAKEAIKIIYTSGIMHRKLGKASVV